jgi:hypothetical protein
VSQSTRSPERDPTTELHREELSVWTCFHGGTRLPPHGRRLRFGRPARLVLFSENVDTFAPCGFQDRGISGRGSRYFGEIHSTDRNVFGATPISLQCADC